MAQIVYAVAGSGERRQLDNGHTGEHIVTSGQTVFDSEDKPGMPFSFPDTQKSGVRPFFD